MFPAYFNPNNTSHTKNHNVAFCTLAAQLTQAYIYIILNLQIHACYKSCFFVFEIARIISATKNVHSNTNIKVFFKDFFGPKKKKDAHFTIIWHTRCVVLFTS